MKRTVLTAIALAVTVMANVDFAQADHCRTNCCRTNGTFLNCRSACQNVRPASMTRNTCTGGYKAAAYVVPTCSGSICRIISTSPWRPVGAVTTTSATSTTHWTSNDQQRAQAKADAMARGGYMSHGAGGIGTIGRFEGIGQGGGRGNIQTCQPGGNMRLSADAVSCQNGRCYRVRAWR